MSHYTIVETKIVDAPALAEGLADMGYEDVEVWESAQPLVDYSGSETKETAEVIVRRKHVGRLANDIGFKRQPAGPMRAIISDWDRDKHGEGWMRELTRRYAYHAARGKLEAQGFTLAREERDADGRIRLTLRRSA